MQRPPPSLVCRRAQSRLLSIDCAVSFATLCAKRLSRPSPRRTKWKTKCGISGLRLRDELHGEVGDAFGKPRRPAAPNTTTDLPGPRRPPAPRWHVRPSTDE